MVADFLEGERVRLWAAGAQIRAVYEGARKVCTCGVRRDQSGGRSHDAYHHHHHHRYICKVDKENGAVVLFA